MTTIINLLQPGPQQRETLAVAVLQQRRDQQHEFYIQWIKDIDSELHGQF